LLTLPSIGFLIAVILALAAWFRARALAQRLERMTESYWELRYEAGQIKSRLTRLETTTGLRDAEPEGEAPKAAPTTSFVPLSSLRK
jgi:hypothetical protein